MTDKKTGGPAFPQDHCNQSGEGIQYFGMTLRDHFAMQAPKEVPHWFQPKMRQMPGFKWVDANGNHYASRHDAKRAVGDEGYWDENQEAREQWNQDRPIQKVAQWPWFWADLQLEARNA